MPKYIVTLIDPNVQDRPEDYGKRCAHSFIGNDVSDVPPYLIHELESGLTRLIGLQCYIREDVPKW